MTRAKVPVTDATLVALAARHGIVAPRVIPPPWMGATSCVHDLGTVVVKIPHDDPHDELAAIASLRTDVAVSSIAFDRGIRAARLIAFDDSLQLLSIPYAIFERVPGMLLQDLGRSSGTAIPSWEAVGRQLALVHALDGSEPALRSLRRFNQTPEVDPRPWVTGLAHAGVLDPDDATAWSALLERLAALEPIPLRLCHGDLNMANVVVNSADPGTVTLIDWAGAGWLDPVWDFAGVPLHAVPHLLRGHRAVSPLPCDETAEARILWCRVQSALHAARQSGEERVAVSSRLSRVLEESMHFAAANGIA